MVFESETCDKAKRFLEGQMRDTANGIMEQCKLIETNDDRGVLGIWLREMSDLRRVS